jgi:hypothetical protein
MGPLMSTRNIVLLRRRWTNTILADKCEPDAVIRAFCCLEPLMAYLDHVTCVRFQTDSFQNSPLSPIRANAA